MDYLLKLCFHQRGISITIIRAICEKELLTLRKPKAVQRKMFPQKKEKERERRGSSCKSWYTERAFSAIYRWCYRYT
jgi:hypothetical protein